MNWLNQGRTSYWQQGCDLGKTHCGISEAIRDARWSRPGFQEGFDFGRTIPPRAEAEPQSCTEADGCPTEMAVLKRFWREHQRPTSSTLRCRRCGETVEVEFTYGVKGLGDGC